MITPKKSLPISAEINEISKGFAPQQKRIYSLLWIMFFDHTCLNITFPVLTLLFFDMQSSLFTNNISHAERSMWYGLCVAIPHIINIIFTPILSALSDEFGRKKILLVGTLGAVLFALTAALGILWGMLSILLLGLLIRGAFSRTNPVAQAIIGDISSKETKVLNMGYLQAAISIGAFIGPIIGGYFANRLLFSTMNFSLPFFIAAIFAGISFLLTLIIFQETHRTQRTSRSWNNFNLYRFKKIFTHPDVWRISIILLLSQISWSIYYQFIPPILKTELNFNANELGFFVGLIAFWLAFATIIGINILQRFFTLQQMLMLSVYLVFIGSLLTLLSVTQRWLFFIWLSAIPTAIGDVIAYSCLIAMYSNAVDKPEQGKVMGICFIVVAIIWALTGMLGGLLMSAYSLLPLIIAPVGIFMAIGFLHSRFWRTN